MLAKAVSVEELEKVSEGDAVKLERAVRLEKECNEVWLSIKLYEEKFSALTFEQNTLMKSNSFLKQESTLAKAKYEDLTAKYNALLKFWDHDLKLSASLVRKEVKGSGRSLLGQAVEYVKSLETRLLLQSDMNVLKSNLTLINQLEKGETSLEKEKVEAESSIAELESELKALPITPLDFQQFTLAFAKLSGNIG